MTTNNTHLISQSDTIFPDRLGKKHEMREPTLRLAQHAMASDMREREKREKEKYSMCIYVCIYFLLLPIFWSQKWREPPQTAQKRANFWVQNFGPVFWILFSDNEKKATRLQK